MFFFLENIENCYDFYLPVVIIAFFIVIFIFCHYHFFPSQTKRGTSRLSWQQFSRLFQAPLLGRISSSRVETRGCFADIPFLMLFYSVRSGNLCWLRKQLNFWL